MTSTRDLVRIALVAALIAALGVIPKFDLPFTAGVPVTLQSLGVMLAGLLLGARNGLLAIGLFLVLVGLGAPVLSGGRGGLGVFFGPTVGFLFGWLAGVWAVGILYQRLSALWPNQIFFSALTASLVGGILAIYAVGIPGLTLVTGMPLQKAALISLAFVPGDLIKAVFAAWIASRLPRHLLAQR